MTDAVTHHPFGHSTRYSKAKGKKKVKEKKNENTANGHFLRLTRLGIDPSTDVGFSGF